MLHATFLTKLLSTGWSFLRRLLMSKVCRVFKLRFIGFFLQLGSCLVAFAYPFSKFLYFSFLFFLKKSGKRKTLVHLFVWLVLRWGWLRRSYITSRLTFQGESSKHQKTQENNSYHLPMFISYQRSRSSFIDQYKSTGASKSVKVFVLLPNLHKRCEKTLSSFNYVRSLYCFPLIFRYEIFSGSKCMLYLFFE